MNSRASDSLGKNVLETRLWKGQGHSICPVPLSISLRGHCFLERVKHEASVKRLCSEFNRPSPSDYLVHWDSSHFKDMKQTLDFGLTSTRGQKQEPEVKERIWGARAQGTWSTITDALKIAVCSLERPLSLCDWRKQFSVMWEPWDLFLEIQVVTGLCRSHLTLKFIKSPLAESGQDYRCLVNMGAGSILYRQQRGLGDPHLPQGRLTWLLCTHLCNHSIWR